MNYIFVELCEKENLEEIKQSYFKNLTINNSAENEEAFRWSCYNGHLKVSKWLLKVKPDINISAENEEAFECACLNRHLKVAKWLLKVKPDINISACGGDVFKWSCQYGHLEVA